jgi:hypothetical protein
MSNWIERANKAYQEKLERIDAQNKALTARLIKATSAFLETEIVPVDVSVPGRITIEEGNQWIRFEFENEEEKSLCVVFECLMCGGDFPVPVNNMEDLGYYLNEGFPEHKTVCRNQQKD